MKIERNLSVHSASLLVVASMIGTGVFTTTGFLVEDLVTSVPVLLCWGLGGAAALFGALSYAEVAAALPHNGGEYAMLSRIYHPALGFTAGFVSLFVGFAAPIAASAIAFGDYLARVFPDGPAWWPRAAGVGLILMASALHATTVRQGSRAQDVMTIAKVVFIVVLVVACLPFIEPRRLGDLDGLVSTATRPEFAVGLVYVSFAYTGWNAAAYVAGETKDPERSLPRALGLGTAMVTALYLLLNIVFLGAADAGSLAGEVEVAHIATRAIFGEQAGKLVSLIIALGLISTVGAMVLTGPRIYEAMGVDHPRLRILSYRRPGGGPLGATLLQCAVAIIMALSASFDALLIYTGATLSLFAGLAAAGVFVLRRREPELARPYRAWGYPLTTILFLLLTSWMIVQSVLERPVVALYAGGTLVAGLVGYFVLGNRSQPEQNAVQHQDR